MIEVTIESIRISLMSEHRVIMLKDIDAERYLPIWIGPYEAEAIAIRLQNRTVPRPLTHDLLGNVINALQGEVVQVVVNDMQNDTYYARITIECDGKRKREIDSRPSDAIALAVRTGAPLYVADHVMDQWSIAPEDDISDSEDLSAFRDFVNSLDLDDLPLQ